MSNKLILLILSTILFFQACDSKKSDQEEKSSQTISKQTVEVNIVEKIAYPIWLEFSGKTEAFQNVDITSRVNGELKEIHFSSGEKIKKGQLLFTIDKTPYLTTLAQKEATLQKDISSLNLATINLKRYTPLVEKGLATQEKLDQLSAEKKQLEASIKANKAFVTQAKLDVKYCDIVATIDGNSGKALVDIGNIVNKGDKLANIVQTKSLYVNFSPSSKNVTLIKKYKSQENPKVKVVVDAQAKEPIELQGEIDFIDNVSNTQTDTVDMRAVIHNDDGLLFAGTFVELKMFITDQIPLIAISPNTISQNQLGAYVLIVDENNKIRTQQIEISHSIGNLIIIKSGLEVGQKVVVSDIARLKEKLEVIVKEVPNKIVY